MKIAEVSDSTFIKAIGPKIDKGFQGDVHEFYNEYAVVKIWRKTPIQEINNEIANSILASKYHCAPKVFAYRTIGTKTYLVMEKIRPIKLTPKDYDDVVELFDTLISIRLVNYDGSFGRTHSNKLVLFDYGVSKVFGTQKEATREYCDFFETFRDFHNVDEDLLDEFCE